MATFRYRRRAAPPGGTDAGLDAARSPALPAWASESSWALLEPLSWSALVP